jgi:guanylate kinase
LVILGLRNEHPGGGRLVVVSGPSGVGKSTIRREAIRQTGARFSVSLTTRPPRRGEVDGRDYRFVDRETFDDMVRRDELLEWAEVFGQRYGTPAEPVRQAVRRGETILVEIDVQGALQVHARMPEATFVLILPPAPEILKQRLLDRGSESEESVARRTAAADREIEAARSSGVYSHYVVNDDLQTAVRQVVDIIAGVM